MTGKIPTVNSPPIQSLSAGRYLGDPYENRTRVFAVRGRRPNR